MDPSLLAAAGIGALVLAVFALVLARPVAVLTCLIGSGMGRTERLAIAWFGPKGFRISITYALLVLQAGVPFAHLIFATATLTIGLSILVHASSDVFVAERFDDVDAHGALPPACPQ